MVRIYTYVDKIIASLYRSWYGFLLTKYTCPNEKKIKTLKTHAIGFLRQRMRACRSNGHLEEFSE